MRFEPRIKRRTFLRAAGLSAGLLALSRLRVAPELKAAVEMSDSTLRVLRPRDAHVLGAIAERMVFTGDPNMPGFGETRGLVTIDTTLLQLDEDVVSQLRWALLVFQYGPPVFAGRLSTFTGLDSVEQDAYLAGWMDSRFELRRLAFQAFKNLSMMGFYAQDEAWKGIHYDGPWQQQPRRVVGLS